MPPAGRERSVFLDDLIEEARPWAKAIRTAIATKKMPPWFASPEHGKFSNDRAMPQSEIETLTKWVDDGAKRRQSERCARARSIRPRLEDRNSRSGCRNATSVHRSGKGNRRIFLARRPHWTHRRQMGRSCRSSSPAREKSSITSFSIRATRARSSCRWPSRASPSFPPDARELRLPAPMKAKASGSFNSTPPASKFNLSTSPAAIRTCASRARLGY